jgi:chloramphenicol 3-O phosphotransferase
MTTGTIIILNGTSSSGKTSIVKVLQHILEEPYVDAGLDKFLWMLPGRYLERPLWDEVLGQADRAGPVGHKLVAGMHQAIAALSMAGNNVIADHVLVEPAWLYQCTNLFCSLPAFFIGVRCPLEVLELREQARRNRTSGQARAQYDLVHAHGIYDLEVDTSIFRPEDCAMQIKDRIQAGEPPHAFKRLRQLEESVTYR